jgi:hypothetical protein
MTQELYALGRDRSIKSVRAFLDNYLPEREPCADDYPVPESSDSRTLVLQTDNEILTFLADHPNEPYALYWNGAGASSTQAMLFYTCDGNIIFGLAVEAEYPADHLRHLSEFVGAEFAMLGTEERPPSTTPEFIALCQQQRSNDQATPEELRQCAEDLRIALGLCKTFLSPEAISDVTHYLDHGEIEVAYESLGLSLKAENVDVPRAAKELLYPLGRKLGVDKEAVLSSTFWEDVSPLLKF